MSFIPKVWNLLNIKNIASLLTSQINYGGETALQRFYSKRFTLGENCRPPPATNKKCDKRAKPISKKSEKKKKCGKATEKCVPFQAKEKKKKKSRENLKKPKKCKATMRNPCDEVTCAPDCTLTKGKRKYTSNDCSDGCGSSKNEKLPCPKGDWEMD